MDIKKTVTGGFKTIIGKSKEAGLKTAELVKAAKIDAEIRSHKKDLAKLIYEIGELTYTKRGKATIAELDLLFKNADRLNQKIDDKKRIKEQLEEEYARRKASIDGG